ncbi:MAG: aminotransferase class I/II-fold pyridoxal phosphate-dependent enzyme [Candidatus Aminicenantes bacterium]|nr:aminotransferase class I/II-fold pyridoxal phosphate-dependent enzyme [Candidatus Aminicenantes bacterium]
MLLLQLDRKSHNPIYLQIVNQIKEKTASDILKPGTKLPSTRQMAEKLGVNRSTVYKAYQELWAQGYIESRPGSYSKIRKRPKIATPELKLEQSTLAWNHVTTAASQRIYQDYLKFKPEQSTPQTKDTINLAQLDIDPRLFPVQDFRRCVNQILMDQGPKVLGYGEYMGYKPLRETIAKRLQMHGILADSDEILITNGSQNGIDLLLKLLTNSGKKVVIESPTYAIILPLLKYHQAELVTVPMKKNGLDLNRLKKTLETQPVSFLFTMPNFQNPTGITSTQSHREELLSVCEAHQIPVVEDGFEEEMKYFGKVPPPIKSMDRQNICIYLGTFSKVLFPGLRIGWITADKECIQRLVSIKRFSDLTSSYVLQAAVNEFCERGYYDLHVKRMNRIFRKRMQTAIKAMQKYLPKEYVSWNEPAGGYLIWVQIKNIPKHEAEWIQIFKENRVLVSPGRYYFPHPTKDICFRLSIAMLNEQEITEGIKRMARAIQKTKST